MLAVSNYRYKWLKRNVQWGKGGGGKEGGGCFLQRLNDIIRKRERWA